MKPWSTREQGHFALLRIMVPELSLVVLIVRSGSGKSTLAHTYFKPTEVLSSDYCRGLIADDENDQSVTPEAFEVLHVIAAKRLANENWCHKMMMPGSKARNGAVSDSVPSSAPSRSRLGNGRGSVTVAAR